MERRVVQLDGPHGLPTIWGLVLGDKVPAKYDDFTLVRVDERAAYFRLSTPEEMQLPAAFIPFVSTP